MSPLEMLFRFEIDFHRRLRTQAPGTADAHSLHTSYALRFRYECLLGALGAVSAGEVETLRDRLALASNAGDVQSARDSLTQLLGTRLRDN
jgi:hypothetical protein